MQGTLISADLHTILCGWWMVISGIIGKIMIFFPLTELR